MVHNRLGGKVFDRVHLEFHRGLLIWLSGEPIRHREIQSETMGFQDLVEIVFVNIDKDNFNEVLKAHGLGLNLTVPNRLSGQPDEETTVKLKMNTIKDFAPESIVNHVPELKRLLELREALKSLRGPLANVPEFRKKVQELVKDETARKQLLKEVGIEE